MTTLPEVSGVRWNELSNRKIKPQFEKRSKREQRRASRRGGGESNESATDVCFHLVSVCAKCKRDVRE